MPIATKYSMITCEVCAEEKPQGEFVCLNEMGESNMPIPLDCESHVCIGIENDPEIVDSICNGVCIECIGTHMAIQLQDRGVDSITCIVKHKVDRPQDYDFDWRPFALHFLPKELHAEWEQQTFDSLVERMGRWTCPSFNCGASGIAPATVKGYPHVECPGCEGRFCAVCMVPWNANQTCQAYRAEHPELLDEEEEITTLRDMAELGARRCPKCSVIIVNNGGCPLMFCKRCHCDFDWRSAEEVQVPPHAQEGEHTDSGWPEELAAIGNPYPESRFRDRLLRFRNRVYPLQEGDEDFHGVCESDAIASRARFITFKEALPYHGIDYDNSDGIKDFTIQTDLRHDRDRYGFGIRGHEYNDDDEAFVPFH